MHTGVQAISESDCDALARLHEINLGNSTIGQLGRPLLKRYYRFVERSAHETLFVERVDGEVVGAAVLSLRPDSVISRFVKSEIVAFALAVVKKTLAQPGFIRTVFAQGRGAKLAPDQSTEVELIQIYVDTTQRNRQVGRKLLRQMEDFLFCRGVRRYCIRTRTTNNEATLSFYNQNGFIEAARVPWKDDVFVFMTKAVASGEHRGAAASRT
jgi:ribosomal protein S18 acetylase RimI-like enzyme